MLCHVECLRYVFAMSCSIFEVCLLSCICLRYVFAMSRGMFKVCFCYVMRYVWDMFLPCHLVCLRYVFAILCSMFEGCFWYVTKYAWGMFLPCHVVCLRYVICYEVCLKYHYGVLWSIFLVCFDARLAMFTIYSYSRFPDLSRPFSTTCISHATLGIPRNKTRTGVNFSFYPT